MDTVLGLALMGLLVQVVVQVGRHFDVAPKVSLAVATVLAATAMTAFKQFVPEELANNIIVFCTATFGTAVIWYEYILKRFIDPTK